MKKIISFSVLILFVISLEAQNNEFLEYTDNKENIVSSSLIGQWQSEKETFRFEKDTTVIKLIPSKYDDDLDNEVVFLSGYFYVGESTTKYPFILVEKNGNPHLVYFRNRNKNPFGDSESFNLFIATGVKKENDILFIGDDENTRKKPFEKYIRVN